MRGQGGRGRTGWRNACVVRAQTIADGLRMVEFAVEGGLAPFGQGARTRIRAVQPGLEAICAHACVYAGEGRMRVLVAGSEGGAGARFMWSLVEGACVRLTAPTAPELTQIDRQGMRLGFTGIRLHLGGIVREQDLGGRARPAANGNSVSRRPGPQDTREVRP